MPEHGMSEKEYHGTEEFIKFKAPDKADAFNCDYIYASFQVATDVMIKVGVEFPEKQE
jgi:hypothetical protein